MSQFDVYPNPSKKSKRTYPFLVDIQNNILDQLTTRLVVPLTIKSTGTNMLMKKLMPEVEFEDKNYLFIAQQITSIPQEILDQPVGSLKSDRELLIDAIDFAITGI